MSDKFVSFTPGLNSPVSNHFDITPSDTVDLATKPRALYIGGSGNIKILDAAGVAVTYNNMFGILPIRAVRVYTTGTTATNIIGIY